MPAAWSYRRCSSSKQLGTDKTGMARQEEALSQWLADHPDYELQAELVDPGISGGGAHIAKGAMGKFIAAANAGTVPPGSVLVVESITRFSREAERKVMGTLLNDFWGNNLGLAICGHDEIYTGELIDSQPHRLHVLLALMQQARAEWLEKSRRSAAAKKAARDKQNAGIRTAGRVPFTILKDENNKAALDQDGNFQIEPVAAETCRMIFDLYLQGEGLQQIAKALNAAGRPTRRKSKSWSLEEVRKVITSPHVIGTLTRAAGDLENYYPAVIDRATWETVQQRRRENPFHQSRLKGGVASARNIVGGACSCKACGSTLSCMGAGRGSKPNARGYIRCRGAIRLGVCTVRDSIEINDWEAMVLAMLRSADWARYLSRPGDQAELDQLRTDHNNAKSTVIELTGRLQAAEQRAAQAWLEETSDERLQTIERALATIREQLQSAEAIAKATTSKLAAAEARPAAADQAALIQQRLAELLSNLDDPEVRVNFNRWLRGTDPQITFEVDLQTKQIELLIGGAKVSASNFDPSAARIALDLGGTGLTVRDDNSGSFDLPDDPEFDPDLQENSPVEEH